jgi:hypothetical protein
MHTAERRSGGSGSGLWIKFFGGMKREGALVHDELGEGWI